MLRFTPGAAGGFAIGVATIAATIFTVVTAPHSVDRSAKADRMPANTSVPSSGKHIAAVEVVGLHDAAIVDRDREGRVLFSTDPVANVTVVTKNLLLPEVTVRETTEFASRARAGRENASAERRQPTADAGVRIGLEFPTSPQPFRPPRIAASCSSSRYLTSLRCDKNSAPPAFRLWETYFDIRFLFIGVGLPGGYNSHEFAARR